MCLLAAVGCALPPAPAGPGADSPHGPALGTVRHADDSGGASSTRDAGALTAAPPAVHMAMRTEIDPGLGPDDPWLRHPRWVELRRRLPDAAHAALDRAVRRTGVNPATPTRILVRVRPAGDLDPVPTARARRVDGRDEAGNRVHVVELFLEPVLTGNSDPDTELTHEMVHVLLAGRLAAGRYAALPRWVREGAALWAAETGDERIAVGLAGAVDRRAQDAATADPSGAAVLDAAIADLVDGLGSAGADHSADDSVEALLAFRRLEGAYGRPAVRSLLRRTAAGVPAERAVQDLTGAGLRDFRRGSAAHARTVLRRMLDPQAVAAHVAGVRAVRDGDPERALDHLEPLATDVPGGPLSPYARYWRARALAAMGLHGEAADAFADVVDGDAGRIGLLDEAAAWAIVSAARAADADPRPALETVGALHPHSTAFERLAERER